MPTLAAATLFVCTWILGCQIARAAGVKNSIEMMGLGTILGSLWLTISVLLVNYVFDTQITAYLLWAIVVLSMSFLGHQLIQLIKQFPKIFNSIGLLSKHSQIFKLGILVLFLLFLGSLVQNIVWPVTDWDALALYDFRARIVAESGSFAKGVELGYFFQYPPYTSLLHVFTYILDYQQAKVWYSLIYISFIIVFYSLMRKRTSIMTALVGAILLGTHPSIIEHSTMAYTNLAYTSFLSLGLLYLCTWFKDKQNVYLILASILVAGSTWVRSSEPFWLIGVLLLLISSIASFRKRLLFSAVTAITGIVIIIAVKGLWTLYVQDQFASQTILAVGESRVESQGTVYPVHFLSQFLVANYYFEALFAFGINKLFFRMAEVLRYLNSYVLPLFNVYMLPFIITGIYDWRMKKIPKMEWLILASSLLIIFVGTTIFSISDSSWNQIGGSANRMSMFLIPLFIYTLCVSNTFNVWLKNIRA